MVLFSGKLASQKGFAAAGSINGTREAVWGEIATPLLWSHAMYLILWEALRARINDGAQKGPYSWRNPSILAL